MQKIPWTATISNINVLEEAGNVLKECFWTKTTCQKETGVIFCLNFVKKIDVMHIVMTGKICGQGDRGS